MRFAQFSILCLLITLVFGTFTPKSEINLGLVNDTLQIYTAVDSRYGTALITIWSNTSTYSLAYAFWLIKDNNVDHALRSATWNATSSKYSLSAPLSEHTRHIVVYDDIFSYLSSFLYFNATHFPDGFLSGSLVANITVAHLNHPEDDMFPLYSHAYSNLALHVTTLHIEEVPQFTSQFRIEYFHMSPWFVSLAYHCSMLILLLVLSRQQPLKAHGFIPMIACTTQILILVGGVVTLLPLEDTRSFNYIFDHFKYPLQIIAIFLAWFNYLRYLAIFNLNSRKLTFAQKKEFKPNDSCFRLFSLQALKWAGHWSVEILSVVVPFIVLVGIYNAFHYVHENEKRRFLAEMVFTYIIYFILFALFFLTFLVDIFISYRFYKQYREKALVKWFQDDIYYFRIQTLFAILVVTPYFVIAVTVILAVDIGKYMIVSSIFNSFIYIIGGFLQFGMLVPITLYKIFRSCWLHRFHTHGRRHQVGSTDFKDILKDPNGKQLFTEYAQSEFSVENVAAYDHIIQYRNENNTERRLSLAKEIYDTYLNGKSSELELNVPGVAKKNVYDAIQRKSTDPNLFDEVYLTVVDNMSDTYGRLTITPQYAHYKRRSKFLEESGFGPSSTV